MADLNADTWRTAMVQSAQEWDTNAWGLTPEQVAFIGRYADKTVEVATRQEKAVTMESLWWFAQGASCAVTFLTHAPGGYTGIPPVSNPPHLITCCIASRILAGNVPLPEVPVADELDPDDAGN